MINFHNFEDSRQCQVIHLLPVEDFNHPVLVLLEQGFYLFYGADVGVVLTAESFQICVEFFAADVHLSDHFGDFLTFEYLISRQCLNISRQLAENLPPNRLLQLMHLLI